MKSKATHYGICQACGAVQKLPEGVLAKHGYTTRWGFFEGVCKGSGHKPFEISCDLIEKFIESARLQLGCVQDSIAETEKATDPSKVWYHEYQSKGVSKPGYVWRQVEIRKRDPRVSEIDGREFFTTVYTDYQGREQRTATYDYPATLEEAAQKLNERYVASVLKPRAAKLAEYIAWQQERVRTWKAQELRPIQEAK